MFLQLSIRWHCYTLFSRNVNPQNRGQQGRRETNLLGQEQLCVEEFVCGIAIKDKYEECGGRGEGRMIIKNQEDRGTEVNMSWHLSFKRSVFNSSSANDQLGDFSSLHGNLLVCLWGAAISKQREVEKWGEMNFWGRKSASLSLTDASTLFDSTAVHPGGLGGPGLTSQQGLEPP